MASLGIHGNWRYNRCYINWDLSVNVLRQLWCIARGNKKSPAELLCSSLFIFISRLASLRHPKCTQQPLQILSVDTASYEIEHLFFLYIYWFPIMYLKWWIQLCLWKHVVPYCSRTAPVTKQKAAYTGWRGLEVSATAGWIAILRYWPTSLRYILFCQTNKFLQNH